MDISRVAAPPLPPLAPRALMTAEALLGLVPAPTAPPREAVTLSSSAPASNASPFAAGREVAVMRSNGQREDGWHVEGVLPDGRVSVRRDNMTKRYGAAQLLTENPSLLIGVPVAVRRSNGQREDGWAAEALRADGTLIMRRGELQRPTSLQALLAENPQLTPAPAPAPAAAPSPLDGPTALGPTQAGALLDRAVFEPNPLGVRPRRAQDLTADFLRSRGLEPHATLSVGDARVHVSRPYRQGSSRLAFVGYVEGADGRVHVRTFYQSGSQGVWRSASHCGANGWIGKGLGEESTNLPIAAQKSLSALAASSAPTALESADAETAFYGNLQVGGHVPPQPFSDQVCAAPFGRFREEIGTEGHGKPETFTYDDPGHAPDFSRREDGFVLHHPGRGDLQATVFRSNDGEHRWMFCQDAKGRAWVGAIERADSPVNTYGVRSDSRSLGSLSMPAVEYRQQIPHEYCGTHVEGHYFDASAYTHRLPPVRDFLVHAGRS